MALCPDEFTIKRLANIIVEKINSKSELIHLPLPKDDPLQRKPLIEKANTKLNWNPKIDLNEGLDKTIKHFKEIRTR